MKSLLINWEKYSVIGFDMDGTLYDEKLFIEQVYQKIARHFANFLTVNLYNEIYGWLLNRWIEKGSSYPYIFSEAMEKFIGVSNPTIIQDCLNIYRNLKPNLSLNNNIKELLNNLLEQKKEIFLITDGNSRLQRAKFESLQLGKWFELSNVVFTGDFGSDFYKPNLRCLDHLPKFKKDNLPVLYLGDRDLDQEFAVSAKFDFLKVEDFNEFWGVE